MSEITGFLWIGLLISMALIGCCRAEFQKESQPISDVSQHTPDSEATDNQPIPHQPNTPVPPTYPRECGSQVIIGTPGPPGPTGSQGIPGVQGSQGYPGNPGNNGNNGQPGVPGRSTEKGNRGEQGLPGLSGERGLPGPRGANGETGERGAPGLYGEPGAPGEHGLDGLTGSIGSTGPIGPMGYPGDRGLSGPPGETGECDGNGNSRRKKSAFSVARTSSLFATSGPVIVTYHKTFSNLGGDFNEATGIFRCSIPGTYFFALHIYKSSTENFPIVQLLKNEEPVVAVIDYGTSDAEDGTGNSVIVDLVADDEVYLQLQDGRELFSSHYGFTTFSGFLIYEA